MDNARIEKLELITTRLMRRASKRTVAMITPYPISNAVFGDDIKGPILQYMFPCDGTVTKGFIRLGRKPKNEVFIEVKLFNDITSTTKGFAVDKKSLLVEPGLKVKAGDCLKVSLISVDEPVTEVWISLLWKPTIADIEVKSFLIEELESGLLEE